MRKHTYRVVPTSLVGVHTGRPRYRVECETCDALIHEATTSPLAQAEYHERHPEDAQRLSY